MPTTFKFINHACFTMTHEGHTIIFDPYLDGSTQDINDLKVEYMRFAELLVKPAWKTMLCIWVGRTNFLLVKCALL